MAIWGPTRGGIPTKKRTRHRREAGEYLAESGLQSGEKAKRNERTQDKPKGKGQKSKVMRYTSPGGSVSFNWIWAHVGWRIGWVFQKRAEVCQTSASSGWEFRCYRSLLADAAGRSPHPTTALSDWIPCTCYGSFRTSMPARYGRRVLSLPGDCNGTPTTTEKLHRPVIHCSSWFDCSARAQNVFDFQTFKYLKSKVEKILPSVVNEKDRISLAAREGGTAAEGGTPQNWCDRMSM